MRFFKGWLWGVFLSIPIWALIILSAQWAFGATYYMRADGSAANKAAASGPCSTAANTMSIATYNGETFSAGDVIKLCDDGGDFTGGLVPPSSGSSGSPIIHQADSGDSPSMNIAASLYSIFINGKNYLKFDGIDFANDSNIDGIFIYNAGNTVGIEFEDCTFDHNKSTPTYPIILALSATSASDHTYYRCSFTNSADYSSVVVPSSTVANNNFTFRSCLFNKTDRVVDQQSGKLGNWVFENNTFIGNEDYDLYFGNSGSTFKIVNNVFEDSSSAGVIILFAQGVADNIIGTPANLDMRNNIFWYSDNRVDGMHLFLYGGTHEELIPLVSSNIAVDPLTTGGNAVGSGSYAAGRGDSDDLPALDLNGNSWTAADVGCYANPAKTNLSLTSNKVAFVGDSIMLGTGASEEPKTAYNQFDALTSGLTVVGGSDYALGGMYADAMRFFIDHVMTTYAPKTVFTDIGLANLLYTKPTNATNQEIADCIVSVLQRIDDWGGIPIWLGMGSLAGDPPDNSDVTAINDIVEAACVTNGWKNGSWLDNMMLSGTWKTDYYADLTTDLHPNDDGHSLIANLAYYLYYLGRANGAKWWQ